MDYTLVCHSSSVINMAKAKTNKTDLGKLLVNFAADAGECVWVNAICFFCKLAVHCFGILKQKCYSDHLIPHSKNNTDIE